MARRTRSRLQRAGHCPDRPRVRAGGHNCPKGNFGRRQGCKGPKRRTDGRAGARGRRSCSLRVIVDADVPLCRLERTDIQSQTTRIERKIIRMNERTSIDERQSNYWPPPPSQNNGLLVIAAARTFIDDSTAMPRRLLSKRRCTGVARLNLVAIDMSISLYKCDYITLTNSLLCMMHDQ